METAYPENQHFIGGKVLNEPQVWKRIRAIFPVVSQVFRGTYSRVVALPVARVADELKMQMGFIAPVLLQETEGSQPLAGSDARAGPSSRTSGLNHPAVPHRFQATASAGP